MRVLRYQIKAKNHERNNKKYQSDSLLLQKNCGTEVTSNVLYVVKGKGKEMRNSLQQSNAEICNICQ